MIYTLTTNPTIDMNFFAKSMNQSLVNRTDNLTYSANGKGVNVSRVLKLLNIQSTILGFFGGFTGRYIINEIEKLGINIEPTIIENDTRINVFINNDGEEYKFVNKGASVDIKKQDELIEKIEKSSCKLLVISGSLPPNIEESFYDKVIQSCDKNGIDVVIDISSKKLKELLKYKPKLIKPNDEELKEIFGIELKNEEDIKNALKYLHKEGARNVLLTLGGDGLYFYNGKNAYYCSAVKVKLISSVCAGDACLATFLSIWQKDEKDIENALKNASAVGADVASSYGIGELARYKEYAKQIEIREIQI